MASVAILRRGKAGYPHWEMTALVSSWGRACGSLPVFGGGKRTHNVRFPKYGMCYASGSFSNMSYPGRRQQGSGQETATSPNETRLSQSGHWLQGTIKYAHPETASYFSSWRPE